MVSRIYVSAAGVAVLSVMILYQSIEYRPEYDFNTDDFIREAGYPVEEYFTVTDDGYILRLYRIPPKKNASAYPILLIHGLTVSSDVWVIQGAKKALAYLLHDSGYDVWLPMTRGTFYTRNHTEMSPSNDSFWNYSLDEIGKFDIPALIDFVLQETGHKEVVYIGHSMGGTLYFVTASERPEYNRKIKLFINLAGQAVTDKKNLWPIKKHVFYATKYMLNTFRWMKFENPLPRTAWRLPVSSLMCSENSLLQNFCFKAILFWSGESTDGISKDLFDVILTHMPDGVAINVGLQFVHNSLTGKFQKLDFGHDRNIERYGVPEPPMYNLSNAKCPIAIYYSDGDYATFSKDVETTKSLLPNVIYTKRFKNLTHADFILSGTARELVYLDIVNLLKRRYI